MYFVNVTDDALLCCFQRADKRFAHSNYPTDGYTRGNQRCNLFLLPTLLLLVWTDQNHCATFTYYPIVEHTEASYERENYAEIGAAEATMGGGSRNHSSAVGGALPAAGEKITMLVENGTYEDCDLSCDVKQHSQMHVRVGILMDMTGEGIGAQRGTLQLLDLRKVSGNKILVLRERRLRLPIKFGTIDWPCEDEDICSLK